MLARINDVNDTRNTARYLLLVSLNMIHRMKHTMKRLMPVITQVIFVLISLAMVIWLEDPWLML